MGGHRRWRGHYKYEPSKDASQRSCCCVTRCSWSRGTNGQKKQGVGPKERRGPVKIICASVLYLNFWGVPVQFGWLRRGGAKSLELWLICSHVKPHFSTGVYYVIIFKVV